MNSTIRSNSRTASLLKEKDKYGKTNTVDLAQIGHSSFSDLNTKWQNHLKVETLKHKATDKYGVQPHQ